MSFSMASPGRWSSQILAVQEEVEDWRVTDFQGDLTRKAVSSDANGDRNVTPTLDGQHLFDHLLIL